MASTLIKISCVALLGARAVAVNAGPFPFSNMLPFARAEAANEEVPNNQELKHVEHVHKQLEVHPKLQALTRTRTATKSATAPKAGNHPTKLLTASGIAKLITQKEGLLKSSSIAMDNYAKALADAQAIVQERKRTAKYGEQAVMAVETELIKLRNAKQDMMEATKMDINRSPLDPAYKVSRSNVSKAEAHVLAAETRVGKANGRAVSLGKQAKVAAARLQQSLADKVKYGEEMRTALTSAQGLEKLLMDSLEQHKVEMQKLVGRVAILEKQDAALASAMDHANTVLAIRDATSASTAAGTQRSVAEPNQDPHATTNQHAPAKKTSSTSTVTQASSELIAEETSSTSLAKETTRNST